MDKYCYLYFLDSGWNGKDGELGQESKDSLHYWLKQDTLNYFKIVFFHHPPYSTGPHGSNAGTQIGFDTLGIDAVICGHDHLYERIERKDGPGKKPLYLIDGTGGARLYTDSKPLGFSKPEVEVKLRIDTAYGAIKAVCYTGKIDFLFYNTHSQLLDKASITH
jgi:hypothetical protein